MTEDEIAAFHDELAAVCKKYRTAVVHVYSHEEDGARPGPDSIMVIAASGMATDTPLALHLTLAMGISALRTQMTDDDNRLADSDMRELTEVARHIRRIQRNE